MSSYGQISAVIQTATEATYISSDAVFAPVSSGTTDIWEIYGSSSKTIKILSIGIYVGSAATGYFQGYLLRRSTANTGGTSTTTTATTLDTNNAAATAVIKTYTANPTTGTSAGQLAAWSQYPHIFNAVGSSEEAGGEPYWNIWDIRLSSQPIILRGTSQGVVINCNGTAPVLTTGRVSVRCLFTEV